MDPLTIINYRVRPPAADLDTELAKMSDLRIFRLVDGREIPASPGIQEILDNARLKRHLNRYIPVQKIENLPRLPSPMLAVEFPSKGFKFVLELRMGLMQWFMEPGPGWMDLTIKHGFYALDVVKITVASFDLIESLQKLHFPISPLCQGMPRHSHYPYHIITDISQIAIDAEGPLHTKHIVCATATLYDVFKSISGARLSHDYSLMHLLRVSPKNKFIKGRVHTLEEAQNGNLLLSQIFGTDVWLLPWRGTQDYLALKSCGWILHVY